jgi:dUTP pyrophosphatase
MRFANIFPVIDSDFSHSSNEGHIHAKVRVENASGELAINAGDAFMQGLLLPFGITWDDAADGVRDGGWGSTGR